jgi:phage-related protein
MEFEINYYENNLGERPVEKFLLALGKTNLKLQAKAFEGITKLRNKAYHKEPLSKYIEPGLWELRIKARSDILRIIYTFTKGQIIILLHGFIKKQQKTSVGELEISRQRLKEIKLKMMN